MMDWTKALADPALVFKTPQEVLKTDLSRDQKLAILRQWEVDARRLQVADEEGMTGKQPAQLQAVLEAMRSLEET